jgi:hypothetical protein
LSMFSHKFIAFYEKTLIIKYLQAKYF